MSTFDGVEFWVEPEEDGRWFPGVEKDAEGKDVYVCRAWIATRADRNQLYNKMTPAAAMTWKRIRGSLDFVGLADAGGGDKRLRVPIERGTPGEYRAVLVGMTQVRGYAPRSRQGFMAQLEFVIITDPTV